MTGEKTLEDIKKQSWHPDCIEEYGAKLEVEYDKAKKEIKLLKEEKKNLKEKNQKTENNLKINKEYTENLKIRENALEKQTQTQYFEIQELETKNKELTDKIANLIIKASE